MDSKTLAGSLYRVEQELGSGGGGIVYKAWNTHLQKYVVIKELKRGTKDSIEVQRNEVEALKNVKSAYLPQVLDFFVEDGHVFTVMEFIDGVSFDKLLSGGLKFTESQVVKWYGQLASALEVIHMQNIAHRDIKPANIMLLPNDDICLIDFNAALVGENDVKLISRSLGYASPEQYEIYERYKHYANSPVQFTTSNTTGGATRASNENRSAYMGQYSLSSVNWKLSDIYSLGATMYHLLTGVRPSEKTSEVKMLSDVGQFDEGLTYIIESSMKYSPSERIPSANALQYALRNIYKYSARWKRLKARQITAAIILPLAFSACLFTSYKGYCKIRQDKETEYYSCIYSMQTCDDPQTVFDKAQEMFDRVDPYFALAERYWSDGDLVKCKDFILSNLSAISLYQDDASALKLGGIYYLLGDCYYFQNEKGDYQNALLYYKTALEYVPTDPLYHRDYAITLAKLGNTENAKEELNKAQTLLLDEMSACLLNGEIEYAEKNYAAALKYFADVISQCDDDYMRYRAFHSSDEIYKLEGKLNESVELLEDSLKKIPFNRIPEMKERLAESYYLNGENAKAIAMFEDLAENSPSFTIQQNLAILYENENDFDRAVAILDSLGKQYPEDYRVPMRKAFLEIDKQSKIEATKRNYSLVPSYYSEALILYRNNKNDSDPEMQQLDSLVEQLKTGGWIE